MHRRVASQRWGYPYCIPCGIPSTCYYSYSIRLAIIKESQRRVRWKHGRVFKLGVYHRSNPASDGRAARYFGVYLIKVMLPETVF